MKNFSHVMLALALSLLSVMSACTVPETKTRAKGSGGAAIPLGDLDAKILNEVSGLVVSRKVGDRLYHVNDSGDGPFLYQTSFSGDYLRRIQIDGFDPEDVEDLAYGPCGEKTCIVIADVGDNKRKRPSVDLVFIEETDKLPGLVKPLGTVTVKYPDGPHNMEGVAMHPNGDLFLLSKEIDMKTYTTAPATMYRLPRSEWEAVVFGRAPKGKGTRESPLELKVLAKMDLPTLLKSSGYMGQGVTAMDISPSGTRFLILTYVDAVEFNIDLSRGVLPAIETMKAGTDYNVIASSILDQQEALAYLKDGSGFIYTSEMPQVADFRKSPILQIDLPHRD